MVNFAFDVTNNWAMVRAWKKSERKKKRMENCICIIDWGIGDTHIYFSVVLVDSFFSACNLFQHGGPLNFHSVLVQNNECLSVILRCVSIFFTYGKKYTRKKTYKKKPSRFLVLVLINGHREKWLFFSRMFAIKNIRIDSLWIRIDFFHRIYQQEKEKPNAMVKRVQPVGWQNNRVSSIYQSIRFDSCMCASVCSKWPMGHIICSQHSTSSRLNSKLMKKKAREQCGERERNMHQ